MDASLKPPRPFRQPAPGRLVIREGGGCLSVFGLPFLAAGVFVALIGLQVIPVTNRDEVPAWAWPVIVLMGLVFVGAGGALVFGRKWTTIDAGQGLIAREAGLLVPSRREEFRVSDFDGVRFRFDAGDSDTADRYPVVLTGRAGRGFLQLTAPTDYKTAREQGAYVADFLRLPLTDATTDHETVVAGRGEPATARGSSAAGERAARPPFMRSAVEPSRGRVRITIPGPGFRPIQLLGFLPSIFIVGYLLPGLLEFFERTRTPGYVQYFFSGFVLLCFGVLPVLGTVGGIVRSLRSRTTVEASADGIRIEERGSRRTRTTEIPIAEIFGLDYNSAEHALRTWDRTARERYPRTAAPQAGAPPRTPPAWLRRLIKSKGVQVKCRQGIVAFGAGLPDDEVRYLYTLVRDTVAGAKA